MVPVALGMLFYPALKSGGKIAFQFAMALTIGLLAFLLVDTLEGALEAAGKAAPGLKSAILVWIVAGLASLLLWGLAHWKGEGFTSLGLAATIAFAIGVHILGEGLAVGSAFATGAAALGGYLLLGFTVHNVTEGVGIIAPLLERRPSLAVLAGLACLAGLPAILGFGSAPSLFPAIGRRWRSQLAQAPSCRSSSRWDCCSGTKSGPETGPRPMPSSSPGLLAGVALMYFTGLLVQI